MKLVCVGMSHQKTPIDIREKFYLNEIEQKLFIGELKCNPSVLGAFVLSTCNRMEVYISALEGFDYTNEIIEVLCSIKKEKRCKEMQMYFYTNEKVVFHLLRVACGLESMVVGEKQILGQIKVAVELAREKSFLNKPLNILTNLAIRAGKKSRVETEIGYGGSSVGWAAVVKIEQKLKKLEGRSVLIIGAGKMGEVTGNQLKGKNIKDVYVMSRTQASAQELASKVGGTVVSFFDINHVLPKVDVCVCSSAAPHYILEKDMVEKILGNAKKQMIFMDVSVPRNIDPRVGELANASLYTVDDLKEITELNMKKRMAAIPYVEQIIVQKQKEYYVKISKLSQYDSEWEQVLPLAF